MHALRESVHWWLQSACRASSVLLPHRCLAHRSTRRRCATSSARCSWTPRCPTHTRWLVRRCLQAWGSAVCLPCLGCCCKNVGCLPGLVQRACAPNHPTLVRHSTRPPGHEYFANEDFEKGITCYRNAIRIDPRHYNAWCAGVAVWCGCVLDQPGRLLGSGSVVSWEWLPATLPASPANMPPPLPRCCRFGMGHIYYRQEKYGMAEYHFRRALQVGTKYGGSCRCRPGMPLPWWRVPVDVCHTGAATAAAAAAAAAVTPAPHPTSPCRSTSAPRCCAATWAWRCTS